MAAYHRELDQEVGSVKVHAVCPGLVATNQKGLGVEPSPEEKNPDTSEQTILGIIEGREM